jgi:hypothetical protein
MSIQGSSALYMSTTVWEKGGIAENRWLGVPVALELDRPLVGPYFTLVGSLLCFPHHICTRACSPRALLLFVCMTQAANQAWSVLVAGKDERWGDTFMLAGPTDEWLVCDKEGGRKRRLCMRRMGEERANLQSCGVKPSKQGVCVLCRRPQGKRKAA